MVNPTHALRNTRQVGPDCTWHLTPVGNVATGGKMAMWRSLAIPECGTRPSRTPTYHLPGSEDRNVHNWGTQPRQMMVHPGIFCCGIDKTGKGHQPVASQVWRPPSSHTPYRGLFSPCTVLGKGCVGLFPIASPLETYFHKSCRIRHFWETNF